jgi:predicted PhzF superfamily epimerase YddE/YHI9
MSNLNISIVDAFTEKSFAGNPAAVCILKEEIDDSIKQLIAKEVKKN